MKSVWCPWTPKQLRDVEGDSAKIHMIEIEMTLVVGWWNDGIRNDHLLSKS